MKGKDFLPGHKYRVDIMTKYETTASIDDYCRVTNGDMKLVAEDVIDSYIG